MSWICVAYIKMVILQLNFLGWGHHQQRCHHPPWFTIFPTRKFIRSHKTTKIDGASKSHLMGLIRQLCEKLPILPDLFLLKSYNKITTVKFWIKIFRLTKTRHLKSIRNLISKHLEQLATWNCTHLRPNGAAPRKFPWEPPSQHWQ